MSENSSLDGADIDAFGIPGYLGRPAGEIRRKSEPEGFRDAFWVSNPTRQSDLHVLFASRVDVEEGIYTFVIDVGMPPHQLLGLSHLLFTVPIHVPDEKIVTVAVPVFPVPLQPPTLETDTKL